MNECIIYYDGLDCCNNPVNVTKRTLKTILLAKEGHEKRNDRHIFKFISRYRYHRNPRCSKYTERI